MTLKVKCGFGSIDARYVCTYTLGGLIIRIIIQHLYSAMYHVTDVSYALQFIITPGQSVHTRTFPTPWGAYTRMAANGAHWVKQTCTILPGTHFWRGWVGHGGGRNDTQLHGLVAFCSSPSTGFEPQTSRTTGECSAAALIPRLI